MSTGLYSHTTRAIGTVLTAAIYNADHANHITNANPSMHGAYSDTVSQMKLNSDPGGVGSESLAGSLAKELEYIRFCIKRISGTAEWYEAPVTSLGIIGGGVPLHLAFASTPLRLRRTENTTAEVEVMTHESGSGAGNKYSRRIVGTASNAVDQIRAYLGATELWRQALTAHTWFIPNDFPEITPPATPDANVARLYAKDAAGTTVMAYKDGAGVERHLGPINKAYAEYATNTGISTTIPFDDSIPLVSEGIQILSAAITLRKATSTVRIRMQGFYSSSVAGFAGATFALFRGSICIAAKGYTTDNNGILMDVTLEIEDTPGNVGPHTYSIRCGPSTGLIYLNGTSGGRVYGGVAKATLIVEELE